MSGENNVVTLSGDDGEKIDCEILGTFLSCGKEYIAVTPVEGEAREGEIFVYGYREHKNGEFDLLDIEDDAEFENAAAEVDRIFDEMNEN